MLKNMTDLISLEGRTAIEVPQTRIRYFVKHCIHFNFKKGKLNEYFCQLEKGRDSKILMRGTYKQCKDIGFTLTMLDDIHGDNNEASILYLKTSLEKLNK